MYTKGECCVSVHDYLEALDQFRNLVEEVLNHEN